MVVPCVDENDRCCITHATFDAKVKATAEQRWGANARLMLLQLCRGLQHTEGGEGREGGDGGRVDAYKLATALASKLSLPVDPLDAGRYFSLRYASASVPWREFAAGLWAVKDQTSVDWGGAGGGGSGAPSRSNGILESRWMDDRKDMDHFLRLGYMEPDTKARPERSMAEIETLLHDKLMTYSSNCSQSNSLLRKLCRQLDLDRTGLISKKHMRDVLNYTFGMEITDLALVDLLHQCDIDPTHPFLYV